MDLYGAYPSVSAFFPLEDLRSIHTAEGVSGLFLLHGGVDRWVDAPRFAVSTLLWMDIWLVSSLGWLVYEPSCTSLFLGVYFRFSRSGTAGA